MRLNEIMARNVDISTLDLKRLTWDNIIDIIGDTDGDRPNSKDKVHHRFVKASLPVKEGMWQGWGFIYEFKYESIDDEQIVDEWVVHVNQDGKLRIRAL